MLHNSTLNLSPAILISSNATIYDTDTDVCYASRCLRSVVVVVYLTFPKGIPLSRCPMSPIIFAHLEFLYRAQLFSFNWFCNGGQVEGRIFKNFMMQRIHRNFLAYYDVARQVPSDFWFFNLFRSTIKHFKVSQAVLRSTHFRAQWTLISGLPLHRF